MIISKTNCDAVKLEGGKKIIKIIKNLVKNKIPVMGHLGLLPQIEKGKFRFKGKKPAERKKILNEAKLLNSVGVFSIVLECIETSLAKIITEEISVPTIGIGASKYCDGQILVTDDLIGLNPTKVRFVKKYSNISKNISKVIHDYSLEVKRKKFPNKKYSY